MSQWTHVAGVIRYDALDILPNREFAPFHPKDVLGRQSYWDDQELGDSFLPHGSEGSLHYHVVDTHHEHDSCSLSAFQVIFWGDLRDYDNFDGIIQYFNRIVTDAWIRAGCFTVEVDGLGSKSFVYRDGLWVECSFNE